MNKGLANDTGLGVYNLDLLTEKLGAGAVTAFTFYWPEQNRWEGLIYEVKIGRLP